VDSDDKRRSRINMIAHLLSTERETGKPVAQVAKDLGINEGTLGNWVNKDIAAQAKSGNGGLSESERAELTRLRRENAELAMERDDAPMFVKSRRLSSRRAVARR